MKLPGKEFGFGFAAGVAVGLALPVVVPAVVEAARPVAKALVKHSLLAFERVKVQVARAQEAADDFWAEVRSEVDAKLAESDGAGAPGAGEAVEGGTPKVYS